METDVPEDRAYAVRSSRFSCGLQSNCAAGTPAPLPGHRTKYNGAMKRASNWFCATWYTRRSCSGAGHQLPCTTRCTTPAMPCTSPGTAFPRVATSMRMHEDQADTRRDSFMLSSPSSCVCRSQRAPQCATHHKGCQAC